MLGAGSLISQRFSLPLSEMLGQLRFIWHPTVSENDIMSFYGGSRARNETHARQVQKFLTPLAFCFWSASDNKLIPANRQRYGGTAP